MKRTKIQIEFGWADTTLNLHIEPGASDEEIDALIEQRLQARADKNWALADELRDKLNALNIELEDGAGGTSWRRK